METTHASLIATDENAIKLIIWIVGLLGSATLCLSMWFVKKIFDEIKLVGTKTVDFTNEIRTEMVEFTNELKYKFRTLNNYAKEHEKSTLVNSEKIANLSKQTEDYKKKTDEHSTVLAKHSTEIDFLKRRT